MLYIFCTKKLLGIKVLLTDILNLSSILSVLQKRPEFEKDSGDILVSLIFLITQFM